MKSRHSDICVICGKRPMTGRDHLPPQCVFPRPRPSDLITVPACDGCNNRRSGLDEEFKVAIGIQAGHGPAGARLFRSQTSRTLLHNRRLMGQLIADMREVELRTPEGLIVGTAPAVPLGSAAYDTVINRIVRGLHWHHTGHILGDRVDLKINWHRSLTRQIFEMTRSWATGVVGQSQFVYKYAVFDGVPLASVWVFQFYGRAWSSGTVTPKEEVEHDAVQDGEFADAPSPPEC